MTMDENQDEEPRQTGDEDWHREWTRQLSDYLDGELTADEQHAMDRHLEACATCATTLDELRRVVDTARSLPTTAPGEHVWQQIASQIGVVRVETTPTAVRPMRRFAFTLPQLAAASVLLTLLGGWGALRLIRPAGAAAPVVARTVDAANVLATEISVSDPQYDAAVSDLEQALQRGRERLDPVTVDTVESDLRIIDEALEEAHRALMADPGNGYLSGHVIETRQRKLELLRRAAALTTESQL